MPGSYLRSHYPKSRAKPTQTTAYSAAGFTSHLRVEWSNYNKPGQETIFTGNQNYKFLHRISIHTGDTNTQFKLLLSLINSDYFIHSYLCIVLQLFSFPATSLFIIIWENDHVWSLSGCTGCLHVTLLVQLPQVTLLVQLSQVSSARS